MRSIRTTLLVALLVPLSVVAAFVSLETFYAARKTSHDLGDKTLLAASLTILERVIATNGNLLAEETLHMLTEKLGDRFFYHVRGPAGAFVTGYSGYPRPPSDAVIIENQPLFYDGQHLDEPVRVVVIQRDFSDRELNGVTTITAWQRTTQRQALTLNLFTQSLTRLVVLVLAAGVIVWFAVRYGLRPLTSLQSAIDRRTPYDLTPIKRTMPMELSGIVTSMNELFARVARSKNNRERFIGDAAHQLRNPIAAIKLQAETALESNDPETTRSGLTQILNVSNTSGRMINKMLSGASAYALDRDQEGMFDLSETLQDVVRDAAPSAFERDQEIALEGTDEATSFHGSKTLVREAISNLVDNAIRYAPPASLVEVALRVTDRTYEITVGDLGPPISEDRFLELSQPFVTGREDPTSSGLGLSIAKDIAKSHGGHVATRPRKKGKEIAIILPI